MATTDNVFADPPYFSQPGKFSDIVLVAEDQRVYVHRNILVLWSPEEICPRGKKSERNQKTASDDFSKRNREVVG